MIKSATTSLIIPMVATKFNMPMETLKPSIKKGISVLSHPMVVIQKVMKRTAPTCLPMQMAIQKNTILKVITTGQAVTVPLGLLTKMDLGIIMIVKATQVSGMGLEMDALPRGMVPLKSIATKALQSTALLTIVNPATL